MLILAVLDIIENFQEKGDMLLGCTPKLIFTYTLQTDY